MTVKELRRGWVCATNLWVVAALLRIDRRGWRSVCATFCGYPQICREPEERVLNSLVIEVDGQGARMPVPLDAGGFLGVAELISILTFWLRSLYSPGVPKSLVDSFPAARHASSASI